MSRLLLRSLVYAKTIATVDSYNNIINRTKTGFPVKKWDKYWRRRAYDNPNWRIERGLPVNPNQRGILTDGPDFTYTDGRPTPYGVKQRARILHQQLYCKNIMEGLKVVDYAKERYQKVLEGKKMEIQSIIDRKLKPKGDLLKNQ